MSDPRAVLEVAQAELVRALCARGALPAGFDERGLAAARTSLACKRAHTAARLLPAFEPFETELAGLAASRPFDDALALASAFARERDVGPAARVELGFAELRGGRRRALACRRGRGLVLAVRLPWLGVRALVLGR